MPTTGPTGEVLVTGAASGIGRAITRRLANDGWTVHATDLDEDGLADLQEVDCETHWLDVTDTAAIERVIERMTAVDAVVNNAGYAEIGPLEDVPVDAVRQEFDANVHGPLRVCQAALSAMREADGGRIVNVSSVFGLVAAPGTGAYSASKFALEGMSDALRRELSGSDIDVALVEPAWVRTSFADGIRDRLAERTHSEHYRHVYWLFEDTGILDGWSLAVDPDTVAAVVARALSDDDPRPRYSVGRPARAFALMKYLPDRVVDAIFAGLLRVGTLLGNGE